MKSPSNEIEVARFCTPLGIGYGFLSLPFTSSNLYMMKTRSCSFKFFIVAIRLPRYDEIQVIERL